MEELMSNFTRGEVDASTRDAGADVEGRKALMPPSDEMVVGARGADGTEENVAPVASLDDYWDDDEDEAIIAAAANGPNMGTQMTLVKVDPNFRPTTIKGSKVKELK